MKKVSVQNGFFHTYSRKNRSFCSELEIGLAVKV